MRALLHIFVDRTQVKNEHNVTVDGHATMAMNTSLAEDAPSEAMENLLD